VGNKIAGSNKNKDSFPHRSCTGIYSLNVPHPFIEVGITKDNTMRFSPMNIHHLRRQKFQMKVKLKYLFNGKKTNLILRLMTNY
jgi:hypothetical protein